MVKQKVDPLRGSDSIHISPAYASTAFYQNVQAAGDRRLIQCEFTSGLQHPALIFYYISQGGRIQS